MVPMLAGNLVAEGKRTEIPNTVPAAMARLISECWAHEAKERPTMKVVVAAVRKMRANE